MKCSSERVYFCGLVLGWLLPAITSQTGDWSTAPSTEDVSSSDADSSSSTASTDSSTDYSTAAFASGSTTEPGLYVPDGSTELFATPSATDPEDPFNSTPAVTPYWTNPMSPEESASYSPYDLNPNTTMPVTPILFGPTPPVPLPVMYNPTNFSPINAGGSRGPVSIVPQAFKFSDSPIFNSLKPGSGFGHLGLLPVNGFWNAPAISTKRSIVASWRTSSKGFRKRTTTGTKRFRSVSFADESTDLRSLRRRTSSTTGMTPTSPRRLRRRRRRTTATRRRRAVTRYRTLTGQSTITTRKWRRVPLARPWLRKTGTPGSRIVPIVLDYDFFVI